jgi:hypothetical protein
LSAVCARRKFKTQFTGTKFPWSGKGKIRSAPAQGTLRAFNRKNQIRRAQCRVKSGAPFVASGDTVTEETKLAGWPGSIQATMARAGREISFCAPDGAGIGGTDCELSGLAAQQAMWPPHAAAQVEPPDLPHATVAVEADANCAQTSNMADKMAVNRFTKLF